MAEVDERVEQLAEACAGRPVSRSTCSALLLIAACPGKVGQLGSKRAVWLLFKLLVTVARTERIMARS